MILISILIHPSNMLDEKYVGNEVGDFKHLLVLIFYLVCSMKCILNLLENRKERI